MRKTTVLIAFAATILSGCDDDVTTACKKMVSFSSGKDTNDANGRSTSLSECKTRLAQSKTDDPEDFAKTVACIEGASDMKGFMDCRMKGLAEQLGDQIPEQDRKKLDEKKAE